MSVSLLNLQLSVLLQALAFDAGWPARSAPPAAAFPSTPSVLTVLVQAAVAECCACGVVYVANRVRQLGLCRMVLTVHTELTTQGLFMSVTRCSPACGKCLRSSDGTSPAVSRLLKQGSVLLICVCWLCLLCCFLAAVPLEMLTYINTHAPLSDGTFYMLHRVLHQFINNCFGHRTCFQGCKRCNRCCGGMYVA